ncbi:MAG: acyl-CoA dehydrogenase family protein [Desulfobacteraceae bacterium]|nr:acyl-CoA dehydrogenase family protein [Desulfobacteraceae bacterium]
MRILPERLQDKIYHDMILHEETIEIRKKAREFTVREIAPVGSEIAHKEESKESFSSEVFYKLAKEDFFKIPFPKEVGGLGLKYPVCATVVTVEELAYISNSIAAIYDVHCILAGHALMYGSDFIKEKYLKSMATGEKIGCFATTEPTASTDLSLRSLKTVGKKKGNNYIVNGRKRFITNSCVADFVVALVNIDGKLCMLVIDLSSKGCRVGEPDKKMGNKGQLTSDIYFDNVEVPFENLVNEEGKGLHVALGTLTYGRIGIGASGVGMAQSAFDESIAYMKKREAFGKKIAQFQYWQMRMAERAIEIENARNLYSKAALRMDTGTEFPEPEAAGAKYYGTQVGVDMARDAVQIFGGYGFMRLLEYDQSTYKVEEIYRDSKVTEIYEGTNEIQKMIIARTLFGKELVG